MPLTVPARRWRAALLAFLAVAVSLVLAAAPVRAEPNEGGSKQLREALESAAKGHIEAQQKLEHSRKRQALLEAQLRDSEAALATLAVQVGAVAAKSYRMGRATPMGLLLNASSPDEFLDTMTRLDLMAVYDSRRIARWAKVKQDTTNDKTAIDREVDEQVKQESVMARKVKEAEAALRNVGGGGRSGGFVNANSPAAKPAPRNANGSWPTEGCTVDDPTPANGCITPRTLHALNESKAAGFTRYASCFRGGSDGEHPLGRACDFAAAPGGFRDVHASGGDKEYGDNLAAFLVSNASRLGVMYVIWYRQIWMPGRGWSSYGGGGGPAGAHTNHVHLSVY